ncbi:MAG: DUF4293 domain-containing protein [bacterium]|nr:DUF4293 domain-containing protein [Candidatus Minthenecus merdequi]
MIQRIQTLYLLIVTILMATTIFFPLILLTATDNTFIQLSFRGFANEGWNLEVSTACLSCLTAIIALLSLGNIFMFNNRSRQVRICIFNMLLMLGWYALLVTVVYYKLQEGSFDTFHIQFASCFPLISIILTFLAMRGVLKDEALVKSLDRLR